ncbi:hypothetical protein [Sphingomonas sp. Root710]|uniref:hypothetical protein n=1 Tax=Sphingomonas sp. Root710 TaxID=1736594 RepID=UPI000A6964DB|nr:hypothetical protein [Sphingomonas sp. Root710]
MSKWRRRSGQYIVKTQKMTDGQVFRLLVGQRLYLSEELDERIYQSFQSVQSSSRTAGVWLIGAISLSILSHFDMLKSFNAGGIDVSSAIFSHTALVALSVTTAAFCVSYCKQTFIQNWFLAKFKQADPSEKIEVLLKFPDAFWNFHFLPGIIGNSRFITWTPKRSYGQIAYLIFFVIFLILAVAGCWILWLTMARDVWGSSATPLSANIFTIILSAAIALLGWMSPFYYDFPKNRLHFGLANLITGLDEPRARLAHLKVHRAASRMGLVKPD